MALPQLLARMRDPSGGDFEMFAPIPSPGRVYVDNKGLPRGVSMYERLVQFNKLTLVSAPTTVAQMYTNLFEFIHSGTGTEGVTLSDDGGVNYATQPTTPASDDNVLITPVAASTQFYAKLTASARWRLAMQVSINTIVTVMASFGFDENITAVDPTGTAGEGARFLFDPSRLVTTGLTAAQHLNWILAHKVNGADTFTATTIPVAAGQDYELVVEIGADLKAVFYIDGVNVGTGPALTSGDTVAAFFGIKATVAPDGAQNMDIRYVSIARAIG